MTIETASGGPTTEAQHSSFLGTQQNSIINELAADQDPEPAAEETATDAVAEPEAEAEPDQPEAEASAEESTEEETADDWLPSDQEKEFPRDKLEEFAKRRYPKLAAILEKDPNNEAILEIVKDKLNSDILIRQMRESATSQEEPTLEEEAEETPAESTAQPDVAKQQQEYQQFITQLVDSAVDPKAVEQFGAEVMKAFGIDETRLKDPNIPKEEKETLQALMKNSGSLGKNLAVKSFDLINTVVSKNPQILKDWIEAAYPGSNERFQTQMYQGAWEAIRSEKGKDGKPVYANLPEFGSHDGAFGQMIQNAERELGLSRGALGEMVMPGAKDPTSQARAKYRLVAKIQSGQKASPAEVAAAVDTGKKIATDASRKRQLGKALGAGKPTQQLDTSPDKDDIDSSLDSVFNEERAKANPFARK